MKLIFMGTADFAVPALRALHGAGHALGLVVCQPDRPKGRGQQLQAPPLKRAALELGLELFQPEKVRDPAALERLRGVGCDALCVAAYGQILPQALLDLPRLMPLNVHASLLPKYRGAAPIEWAIARGEAESGVSIQRMALKLDAGDVLLEGRTPIGPDEEAPALAARLAPLGAQLLLDSLKLLEAGKAELRPQDEASASYAPLLKKSDGAADFGLEAGALYNRWRAFNARPGFYAALGGEALRVHKLSPAAGGGGEPGTLLESGERGFRVACGGGGSVWLERLQSAGGRPLPAPEWARGHRVEPGARFGRPDGEA